MERAGRVNDTEKGNDAAHGHHKELERDIVSSLESTSSDWEYGLHKKGSGRAQLRAICLRENCGKGTHGGAPIYPEVSVSGLTRPIHFRNIFVRRLSRGRMETRTRIIPYAQNSVLPKRISERNTFRRNCAPVRYLNYRRRPEGDEIPPFQSIMIATL